MKRQFHNNIYKAPSMLYVFITNQVKYTMAQSLDVNDLEKLYGILAIL